MVEVSEELDTLINELIDLCGDARQQKTNSLRSLYVHDAVPEIVCQRIRELRTIEESFLTYKLGVAATMAAELA